MTQAVAFLVGIYGLVCLITGYIVGRAERDSTPEPTEHGGNPL